MSIPFGIRMGLADFNVVRVRHRTLHPNPQTATPPIPNPYADSRLLQDLLFFFITLEPRVESYTSL